MEISVIIPSYRPKDYIYECLGSLAVQTMDRAAFEVIVILNGCRKPYYAELRRFVAKEMMGVNVRLIQTDTAGVSNARNIGMEAARGEYIAFIDDDDYVSPNYLQQLRAKAALDTISLCYPYAFNDGEPGVQLAYPMTRVYDMWADKEPLRLSSTVRKFFSGPCMKLIPMNFIAGRKFDPAFSVGEDSLFMFLISDRFNKFAFTDKTAVYYRRVREGSALRTRRPSWTVARNAFSIMGKYSKIYIKGFPHYNVGFYLTRLLGAVRSMLEDFQNKTLGKFTGGGYELTPSLQMC